MHVHNIFELWKNKRKKGPDLFCSCNEIKKIFKKYWVEKRGLWNRHHYLLSCIRSIIQRFNKNVSAYGNVMNLSLQPIFISHNFIPYLISG